MAAEQCGTEKVCKTRTTGSIPAVASNYMNFIDVMRRDNPQEMYKMMADYYNRIGIPGWTSWLKLRLRLKFFLSAKDIILSAHDMTRLGSSIVMKYEDLQKRYIELGKENAKLKRNLQKDETR